MLFIKASCGSVPVLYLRLKRESPRSARRLHDLRRDRLRRANAERSIRAGFAFELRACGGWPAALAADAVDHRFVVRPELVLGLLVGRRPRVPGECTATGSTG